jgi:hypothetical protein
MNPRKAGKKNWLARIPTQWDLMVPALETMLHRLRAANLQEAIAHKLVSRKQAVSFVKRLAWLVFSTDDAGREWMACPRCGERMRVIKRAVLAQLINQTQVTVCKTCSPWKPPPRGCGLTPRQQINRAKTDGG